jgi:hypothetical protein
MCLFEILHEADQLGACAGEAIRGILFVWQIPDNVFLAINVGLNMGHIVTALFVCESRGAGTEHSKH